MLLVLVPNIKKINAIYIPAGRTNSRSITNISPSHLYDSDSAVCDYLSLTTIKLSRTHRQCFSAMSSSLTGSASSQSKIVSRSLPLKSNKTLCQHLKCLLLKVLVPNHKVMVLVMDIHVLVVDIRVLT